MVLFHLSPYKDFKHGAVAWLTPQGLQACLALCLGQELGHCFADLPSTSRFVALMPRLLLPLWLRLHCHRGQRRGIHFAHGSKRAVCHNPPISGNRVFQGLGQRGRTAMGWFFGFKLYLLINHQDQIMALRITGGTTDDRQCWSA